MGYLSVYLYVEGHAKESTNFTVSPGSQPRTHISGSAMGCIQVDWVGNVNYHLGPKCFSVVIK